MQRALLVLAFVLVASVRAQDGAVSYVEADGEATIFAPPTHVEFLATFGAQETVAAEKPAEGAAAEKSAEKAAAPADGASAGVTNASATAAVDEAVRAFRKALNEFDVHPVDFEVSTPTVRNAAKAEASATARMRFSLAGFSNPDTGPAQFAELCDKLAALAKGNHAVLAGPEFEVEDKETVQRSAVTQAIANAYPIADALALALSSRISAVEVAKVTEITWNKPLRETAIEPNLKQVSCTAKVHVTYNVPSQQP